MRTKTLSSQKLEEGSSPKVFKRKKSLLLWLRIFKQCMYQSDTKYNLESMEFASNRIDTFKQPVERDACLHEDSVQSPRELPIPPITVQLIKDALNKNYPCK